MEDTRRPTAAGMYVVIALVLIVTAGCSSEVTQPTTGPTAVPVFFPRRVATDGAEMAALAHGVLTEHGGCIWLREPTGHEYLVIWPATYQARVAGDRIEVAEGITPHRAFVGDTVELFGGEMGTSVDQTPWIESLIGRPIPVACRTKDYWVGGLTWTAGKSGASAAQMTKAIRASGPAPNLN
jgi:hypothetical protein